MRLARSLLSVPASDWRKVEKAYRSGADMVLLDLEDSVALAQKAASRASVVRAIRALDRRAGPALYRINGLDTPYWYRDVIDVVEAMGDRLDLIMVPKVGRPADLYVLETLLGAIEASLGLPRGRIRLQAQIETAQGLANVERIARASPRLEALVYGPGDLAASLRMPSAGIGVPDKWDARYPGHRFHYAMQRIVVAARAAGLQVLDGPFADYRDAEGHRASCLLARGLGFDGIWCIYPDQVATANEVFAPAPEELAWAQRVLDAYAEAQRSGSGVISLDNRMIDAASLRLAQTTLDLARQAGML